MVNTTYTNLRARLAEFMDRVVDDNEIVLVSRNKTEAVAMIAVSELEGLLETAHLLRSPANRKRLMDAYQRAGEQTVEPSTPEDLVREVGLGEKETR
jgi:antitoxin YefM